MLGALLAEDWRVPRLRLVLVDGGAIGFCGGFTTFDGYALNVVVLLESELLVTAIAYALASVFLNVIAVAVGAVAVRRWRATRRAVDPPP